MPGSKCRTGADCLSDEVCFAPGQVLCGGPCTRVTTSCTADSDCATDAGVPLICDQDPCACGAQPPRCLPGCTSDVDCGDGMTCGTNHHCLLIGCGAGKPACPTNFSCDNSQSAVCVRTICATDSQCSGACVAGQCYATPGQCMLPPV
jgi:hypothetical protein